MYNSLIENSDCKKKTIALHIGIALCKAELYDISKMSGIIFSSFNIGGQNTKL